jgi:hypothetical protein
MAKLVEGELETTLTATISFERQFPQRLFDYGLSDSVETLPPRRPSLARCLRRTAL